ncbi:MAG TPA: hypothetical protein VGG75_40045 [Trebonia sp.]
MIYIRYKSLSPGRHAEAERGAHGTVVYLLPGLAPAQRKAALRRLRQEGSRSCGPALPVSQLLAALAVDWMLSGLRHVAAAVRVHPGRTLVPALLAGVLLALVATVSGSFEAAPAPGSVPSGVLAPDGTAGTVGAVSGSAYGIGPADSADMDSAGTASARRGDAGKPGRQIRDDPHHRPLSH